jgi:hypothetical protein
MAMKKPLWQINTLRGYNVATPQRWWGGYVACTIKYRMIVIVLAMLRLNPYFFTPFVSRIPFDAVPLVSTDSCLNVRCLLKYVIACLSLSSLAKERCSNSSINSSNPGYRSKNAFNWSIGNLQLIHHLSYKRETYTMFMTISKLNDIPSNSRPLINFLVHPSSTRSRFIHPPQYSNRFKFGGIHGV